MNGNKYVFINKYTSLFHDGIISKVIHNDGKIELWMESAELIPEWNEDNIILSERNSITGKLILFGVKELYEDNKNIEKFKIKDSYNDADIFRFHISGNNVILVIRWIKYDPEYEASKTFEYNIQADKIIWENDPTLNDFFWADEQ